MRSAPERRRRGLLVRVLGRATLALFFFGAALQQILLLVSFELERQSQDETNQNDSQQHHGVISHQLRTFVEDHNRSEKRRSTSITLLQTTKKSSVEPGNSLEVPSSSPNLVRLAPNFDPRTHNRTVLLARNHDEQPTASSSTALPGLFWEERLWLLGARLTTLYEENDDEDHDINNDHGVFLTIFGMPGDFHNRTKSHKIRCPSNTWYNGQNGTILSFSETQRRVRLFASFTSHATSSGDEDQQQHTSSKKLNLLPLEFIPSISGDTNQNKNTLIWHGYLGLSRTALMEAVNTAEKEQEVTKQQQQQRSSMSSSTTTTSHHPPTMMALRVTVYASLAQQEKSENEEDISTTPIMTVDIPIATGIVGQAGPQVVLARSNNKKHHIVHSSHSLRTDDDGVTLCVAIYGDDTIQFLPEFILHHTNLGFGPIVVGIVDATIGSDKLYQAQELLQDFVDQGKVEIAAMGLPAPVSSKSNNNNNNNNKKEYEELQCEVNVRKQHFYNTCLYHAKGRTPYVGIWDIDEFWVPPTPPPQSSSSSVSSTNSTGISMIGQNSSSSSSSSTTAAHSKNSTNTSTNNNYYSTSMTVGQAMAQIQNYQESAGCGESWCYHAFPSWFVFLRRQPAAQQHPSSSNDTITTTTNTTTAFSSLSSSSATSTTNIHDKWTNNLVFPRTGKVLKDFELRETEVDWEWSKSITRTKYAFMGGLHQTGSCRFTVAAGADGDGGDAPKNNSNDFVSRNNVAWYDKPYTFGKTKTKNQKQQQQQQQCRNLRLEGFGMIHHYYSLNRLRTIERTTFGESCLGEGGEDSEESTPSKDDDDDEDDKDSAAIPSTTTEPVPPCVVDEYVALFGKTVDLQLNARRNNNDRLAPGSFPPPAGS